MPIGDPVTGGAIAPEVLGAIGTFSLDEIGAKGHSALSFTAYMTKAPVVVAGYGGWSRVARPHRKALTEWVGRDSVSIQIEFLVDTVDDDTPGTGVFVENQCRDLESIGGVESTDPEPPLCRLSSTPAPLMPHGYHRATHVKWFLDTLAWDADQTIYNRAGNRVRAAGTLTMTQFVEDTRLQGLSASKRRKTNRGSTKRSGSKKKTYVVKPGDTLSSIAAKKSIYGDSSKWHAIARANKIRDPRHLKVGTRLRIP
jgi:hypothetical protein